MLTRTQVTRAVAYSVYHFVQFLLCLIFTVVIALETRYGKNQSCLLNISDYKRSQQGYSFVQESILCATGITFGSIGLLFSAAFLIINLSMVVRQIAKQPRFLLLMSIISSFIGLMVLVAVSLIAEALRQTCLQFESSGTDCYIIFFQGFHEQGSNQVFSKDLNKIRMAIATGFSVGLMFMVYSLWEFVSFKKNSRR